MIIYGTIATGVETLKLRVQYNIARGAIEFCSKWQLTDAGNNEFIQLGNITDMDRMSAFLSTEEEIQWDKDNGCVYKIYTMDEIRGYHICLVAIKS